MALGTVVAADIASALLTFYVRGDALSQTMQERPLLAWLRGNKETFPGGKDNISSPVQGSYMEDTAGFFSGYSEDDALNFTQAQNILRVAYPWKEVHAGLIITWTELKKDGITVDDDAKTSEHSKRELVVLTGLLKNRLADYGESYARATNKMFWNDGSQDAKAVPGITSILTDVPAVGVTGGLNRATYPWWQHRVQLGIVASKVDQTLTTTLRNEMRQLRRFGGKPNKALCGSKFIEALEMEIQAKGILTQDGFTKEGKNDFGMAVISLKGLGTFDYDPTLDDKGMSKRCFVMGNRMKLRPMTGEENKVLKPTRPYNYAVFLQSMTWTGGLECTQLNEQGVYSVA